MRKTSHELAGGVADADAIHHWHNGEASTRGTGRAAAPGNTTARDESRRIHDSPPGHRRNRTLMGKIMEWRLIHVSRSRINRGARGDGGFTTQAGLVVRARPPLLHPPLLLPP